MIEELEKKYDEIKKNIDILPVKTKANRKRKQDYIRDEIQNDNARILAVKKEIERRLKVFDGLKENPDIARLQTEMDKCNIVNEWNIFNTSYEKMKLDYYLYQLSNYYKEDLEKVNNCLNNIIQAFKEVGISLKKEDFNYNEYAAEYMEKVINNTPFPELKTIFERLYWKNPDIIRIIEANFKSIYLKYEKSINKYYEERHKKFLKKYKDEDIVKLRIGLNNKLNTLINQDQYRIFQGFVNKEYSLNDYKDVDKIKDKYFKGNSYNYNKLNELIHTLNEYKLLINYKYIFTDMKEKLDKKDTFKKEMANSLKKINSEEKKLLKLNKKKAKKPLFGSKKNDEKWLFDYKTSFDNIVNNFKELEISSFDNTIFTKLSKDSTILDTLKTICSNYLYFVSKTMELDESQNIEDINKKFEDLNNYVYYNDFYFLNNIALLDEKQMKELICNKYNLENISLSIDNLLDDSIDSTIKDITKLINYEDFIKAKINIDDISLYSEYSNMS